MPFDSYEDERTTNDVFSQVQYDGHDHQMNRSLQNNHFTISERPSNVDKFEQFCNRKVSAAFDCCEHSSIPKCTPNTRVDVRERIAQWSTGVHDRPICWLRGAAGSGKSAIAQSIAEECKKNGELAASFFFDRKCPDRSDITNFIPTIVYQLSITVPQTKVFMHKAFECDPTIPDQTRQEQFEKLIVDPLLKLGDTVSPKVVVIDALDQDDGESWVEDLIILLAGACRNDRFPLRFCLTSRTDACTQALFEGAITDYQCRIYFLALEDFDTRDDIRTFFQEQFPTRYVRDGIRHIEESWPSLSDLDRLVAKSSGLFTSASSIVEFVNDGRDLPHLKLQTVLTSPGVDQPAATCPYPQELVIYHLVPLIVSDVLSTQESAMEQLESLTMLGGAEVALNAKAIPLLVELLKSSDIAVLYKACRILDNITLYTDLARAEAFNANAIPALIYQLSSKDTRVQRSAMLALKNTTLHAPALAAAVTSGALPTLVGILSSHDVVIQASAVTVLGRIVAHDTTVDAVVAKVIPYLIKLLWSKNAFVLTKSCEVLVDIALDLSRAQAEALDDTVIHPLICLLCSENKQVQKSVTFTLMSLTLHDPAKTIAIQLGAIPNLVSLLGSDSASIQASAAAVLENITVGNGAVDAIKANAVPALVKLLTSDNTVVLIAVCAALKNITSTHDCARAEALKAGAVRPLIHLLSSRDVAVQKAATFALMNITLHEPAKPVALASGAIPAIARLLGSNDIHIQASAAAVLENIAVGNGAMAAVEANTIPSLVKLLTSGSPVVLIATCAALKNITSVFDRARVEALNANAIPPLVRLLSFSDIQVQRSAMSALKNITLHGSATLSSDAISSLIHLLASDDTHIQASAATVLGNITARGGAGVVATPNAIPSLVGLLLSSNVHVFIAAWGALKNMLAFRCARAGALGLMALTSRLRNYLVVNNRHVKSPV